MNYIDTFIHQETNCNKDKMIKTTIHNIEEEKLDLYINRIKKNNQGVTIYNIKYHKRRKTLIILANKKISIHRNYKSITPIKNDKDIKKEIIKLSKPIKINDKEYTSLENVRLIINKVYNYFYNKIENIKDNIDKTIVDFYGSNSSIVIYECKDNIIKLGFSLDYKERKYKNIVVDIRDNGWTILNTDYSKTNNLLKLIINELYKLNKVYNELKYFEKQYTYNNSAVNTNFRVDIDFYYISIYISNIFSTSKLFEIKYSTYEDKSYINGTNDICEACESNNLLKNIYIPIINCPEWCQEELYNLKNQENHKRKIYTIKRYSKK